MTDAPIPEDLLDLTRQFLAATAATKAAAQTGEPIDALMDAERDLAVALHRRRAGTPWAAWEQQKRVREAAAGGE